MNNEKDIEELRWEFLKRSAEYKKFCTDMDILSEDYVVTRNCSQLKIENILSASQMNKMLDSWYLSKKNGATEIPFFSLHGKYGNVHEQSFDEYWKDKKTLPVIVKDFIDEIGSYVDSVARIYQDQNAGREPSIAELKKELIDFMQIAFEGYVYLLIAQRDFTYQEADKLKDNVGKILKERCQKKRFVKDELKRYLDVYDMRTKKPPITYREIQKKLYPKIDFTDNTRRARINDFNKAKIIINNIEKGKFFYW